MKMAGIDVHKKVLMVVVVDTSGRKRSRYGDDLSRCRVSYSDSESGYRSRVWKRRSWNPPRSTGGRCGWNWSRI